MTTQHNGYYLIETYGCQMNERDSEVIAGLLETAGYQAVPAGQDPDLVVINTCSVRDSAEKKIYGRIGQWKDLRRRKPSAVVAVGGCMAQAPGTVEFMQKKYPHVELVFGTHNLHRLPEFLQQLQETGMPVYEVANEEHQVHEGLPSARENHIKAWVNVTLGCNNFCTYCIVPYVRGRERSRNPAAIAAEVEELVAAGYKEVTLLGQNVNSYGKDLPEDFGFAELLQLINRIAGLERIRFTTSHPRDFTRSLIETCAGCEKVCEHFHLPLQAGSNRILKLMNRGYSREEYFRLVDQVRELVPGAAITTDLIVGFPGETEADFQDTLAAVEYVRFDNAFTFMYSPRQGTKAAEMPDQLPRSVKRERLERLMKLQYGISRAENEKLVGQRVQVLVEGESKKDPTRFSGRTRTNKLVVFPGEPADVGQLRMVEIKRAKTWTLHGEKVEGCS
ncbi:MAG TPA: tRNA (N6-isopentenyl adenosine(37)-C2)-methylthiotransferase MiaB [Firmicutes bacterium]|jgi:tRNA-2-methylthio-N6-dimethylallyladenosine synthase|nr:tRNA (N6-isopentenyl adenosine(37)-C2)-methylthiotransferase MiaB [Bacillota bacterium]